MNMSIMIPDDCHNLLSDYEWFLNTMIIMPDEVYNDCLATGKQMLESEENKEFFDELNKNYGVSIKEDKEVIAMTMAMELLFKRKNS